MEEIEYPIRINRYLFLKGHCSRREADRLIEKKQIRINGKIIGTVGFNSINHVNSEAEIGYWLDQNSTGNGYITSAVKKLIEIGFQQYSLNRLVIRVAVGNEPSRRVAQRLDFQFEGIAQQGAHHYGQFLDLEIYSLLKRDWQNR